MILYVGIRPASLNQNPELVTENTKEGRLEMPERKARQEQPLTRKRSHWRFLGQKLGFHDFSVE